MAWIMLGAACVAMYRIAEMGERRGWVWGVITFFTCFGCASIIPLPLINIGIGFVLSYVFMIAASVVGDQQRST